MTKPAAASPEWDAKYSLNCSAVNVNCVFTSVSDGSNPLDVTWTGDLSSIANGCTCYGPCNCNVWVTPAPGTTIVPALCVGCGTYGCTGGCTVIGCPPYKPYVIPLGTFTLDAGTSWNFTPVLSKGKQKADILAGFFNQDLHALAIMDEDGGARFIPFMDKFGMVWLQTNFNTWAAYDKAEFMKWVGSEESNFSGPALTKEQVLRKFHNPNEGS